MPVEEATAEDVPAIVALLTDDALGAGRESADLAPYERAFRAIERDPGQTLAVVRDGDEVVATMQVSLIPNMSRGGALRAQIEGVRVAASHRGGGLGGAFLAWAEEYATSHGATLAQLTTDRQREDAQRFYERAGWVPSHVGMKKSLG
ncbi:GNAT family N-acetyltransferase [Mariniluteicoccus endophyticus]